MNVVVPPPPKQPGVSIIRIVIIICLGLVIAPALLLALGLAWYFYAPIARSIADAPMSTQIAWAKTLPSVTDDTIIMGSEFRATRNGMSFVVEHAFSSGRNELEEEAAYLRQFGPDGALRWEQRVYSGYDHYQVVPSGLPDGSGAVLTSFDGETALHWGNVESPANDDDESGHVEPLETAASQLVRFDTNGKVLWHAMLDYESGIYGTLAAVYPDGAVLVVGNTDGNVSIRATENYTAMFAEPASAFDTAFIARFDPQGKPQWIKRLSRAGRAWGNEVFDDGSASFLIDDDDNVWLVRVDATGAETVKTRIIQSESDRPASCYDFGSDGTLIFGSLFRKSMTISPEESSRKKLATSATESLDFALMRFKPDGTLEWATQLGPVESPVLDVMGNPGFMPDVCIFDDGSSMVEGILRSSVTFPNNDTTITQRGTKDGLLVAYFDADGNLKSADNIAAFSPNSYVSIHNLAEPGKALFYGSISGSGVLTDPTTDTKIPLVESGGFWEEVTKAPKLATFLTQVNAVPKAQTK